MWDNPRILNALASTLITIAIAVFAFAGIQLVLRSALFPLREITVLGVLDHTARDLA